MKSIWLVVIVISVALAKAETSGFGYELIMSVLETMQSNDRSLDRDLRSVASNVNQLMDSQRLSKSTVQNHYEQIKQDLRSVATKMEILTGDTKTVVTKLDQLIDLIVAGDSSRCPENAAKGVYKLKPVHSSILPFSVYCDNGWIEIQSRSNGRLDFNRTWASYREGFGDIQGDHWLGLEKMHQITRVGSYELEVILKNFEGVVKRAKYKGFKISSELEQYQLNLEKFLDGEAGDSLMYHDKMKFSAPDRDNDQNKGSCAVTHKSGWWFKDCYHTNLNGFYEQGKIDNTMSWWHFNKKHDCLKSVRMLIRRE